eukprot:UC1_evm1s1190
MREFLRTTPAGFAPEHVFVCESRYNSRSKTIQKIKQFPKIVFSPELVARKHILELRSLPKERVSVALRTETDNAAGAGAATAAEDAIDNRSVRVAGSEGPDAKGCDYFRLIYLDGIPFSLGDFVYLRSESVEPFVARVERM